MPKHNYHATLLPNQCYHIYNHAIGKEDLFKQPKNYDFFWQEENRHGSLFKAKFKRTLVNSQVRFDYFLCYIHHNPIHHHFVTDYEAYDYSSYSAYLENRPLEGLSKRPVLKRFKTHQDVTGRSGFIALHQDFKDHYDWDLRA